MSVVERAGVGEPPVAMSERTSPAIRGGDSGAAWKPGLVALLILTIAYGLLQNGRWVSGTDTGYYIAVAKNLALGQGFMFNGGAVKLIPPLWPLTLSVAMRLSTSFWVLNLLPLAGMLIAAACWFGVLRRLMSPTRAAVVVTVSGLLFFSYMSSVQLRTEALFCPALAAAVLLAMQVAEGRKGGGRLVVLCALVASMVLTRWIGVSAWAVVAAALLNGRRLRNPELATPFIMALVTLLVAVGTFGVTRLILSNFQSQPGGQDYEQMEPDDDKRAGKVDREDMDALGAGGAPIQSVFTGKGFVDVLRSFGNSGKWTSSLMWMPAYMGVTDRKVGYLTNAVGWVLIALFGYAAWREVSSGRRWLWIGVMLYCATLVFRMRDPNPRYFVPVAPLILAGVWQGLEYLAQKWRGSAWGTLARIGAPVFLISVLAVNVTLWGIDVYVFRSGDFYSSYRAGNMDKLLSAARYLSERGLRDGEVAVSPYYHNLGRPRPRRNGEGLRATAMMTGAGIRSVPEKLGGQPSEKLIDWMTRKNVRYYLYRPPESPWRAHHFRIPKVQSARTGVPVEQIPQNPSWDLYELKDGKMVRVELDDPGDWPTHVPGL